MVVSHSAVNSTPQEVFGRYITYCEDFFRLVTSISRFIPQITAVLVDHFFPNYSSEKKEEIVKDIVDTRSVQFHDIFIAIIFSKEYLLNSQHYKSFEESFLHLAEMIQRRHEL